MLSGACPPGRSLGTASGLAIVVLLLGAQQGAARQVSLDLARFSHVALGDVKATDYRNAGRALVMRVDKSASFLLAPFEEPQEVRQVSFRWRSVGARAVDGAAAEETNAGDDHRLRVGLLIAGDAPLVPVLAPAWVRAVRDRLASPSDHMIYLVAGSHHPAGSWWMTPRSDAIDYVATSAEPIGDGWMRSELRLSAPVMVVGLWLMADGDDTHSTFETTLEDLDLE